MRDATELNDTSDMAHEYRPWRTIEEFSDAELLHWRLALLRHQIDATELTVSAYGAATPTRSVIGRPANSHDPMQSLLEATAMLRDRGPVEPRDAA